MKAKRAYSVRNERQKPEDPPKKVPPPPFQPPALPNAPAASHSRVVPTAGKASAQQYRRRYLASFRACRDAERAYGQESILKGASGREFGSEGLGFGERIPVAPTRSTERERADRLVDALLAPDLGRADPKFKPESVSRIGPDEARFWPSAVYDAYKPPRSDTMKPSSPIQRARSPVKQTEEDDEAAELFFDIDKALEDGAYRARLVGRRGIFDAPDDDVMVPDLSEHGVVRPPRARVVREMAFLAQARESPTTDV
mmetsp:Transcript_26999/g.83160  ORF Transcript_26999/g.83160 Transcript_26999/m.83160 type:complete len:256 (+) Transcript_26999:525-1292(+)